MIGNTQMILHLALVTYAFGNIETGELAFTYLLLTFSADCSLFFFSIYRHKSNNQRINSASQGNTTNMIHGNILRDVSPGGKITKRGQLCHKNSHKSARGRTASVFYLLT